MRDLLRQFAGSPRPQVAVHPDDPAVLLFTGGTTGTPKAALGTHGGLLAAGMQLRSWFVSVDDWEDVIVLLMPLFHVYGNVGVLVTGFVGRNPLALIPDPRALSDVIDTIRRVRPSFLPGVPTLFNALDDHPEILAGKVGFSSIKLCISGAAPLLAEGKRRFEELTGGRMTEAYGRTERRLGAYELPGNNQPVQRLGYLPKDAPRRIGEYLATLHRPEGKGALKASSAC